MPKPVNVPGWTSTTNAPVEPLAAKKTAGWALNEAPPSANFNWFWKLVSQWIDWLNGLQGEALNWSATQTFASAKVTAAPAAATDVVRKTETDALDVRLTAAEATNTSQATAIAALANGQTLSFGSQGAVNMGGNNYLYRGAAVGAATAAAGTWSRWKAPVAGKLKIGRALAQTVPVGGNVTFDVSRYNAAGVFQASTIMATILTGQRSGEDLVTEVALAAGEEISVLATQNLAGTQLAADLAFFVQFIPT